MKSLETVARIEQRIYLLRGHKVMLDRDLAKLYGVTTKRLNEQVKRNRMRFPPDFMFRLNEIEVNNLRSQFATSSWGGRRYLPLAFTEPGVAMLSSVLNSERAIQTNIAIIRTFIRMRELATSHRELTKKLLELEGRLDTHDTHIRNIFQAIRNLMEPPEKPKPKIGFRGGRRV